MKLTGIGLLLGCILVTLGSVANGDGDIDAAGQTWRSVSGQWRAALGPIVLRANGETVTGFYNGGKWALRLQYTSDKRTLVGAWDHLDGMAGPVVFYLNHRGDIVYGKWGHTGARPCSGFDDGPCANVWAVHGRLE